jgi:perosamine synthetase
VIPIADPPLGEAEADAVRSVIEDGMVADGPTVRRFESAFAEFCGAGHAVATANGTTALHAALEALDIGAGDRVVTTPFSFVASANAIRLAGATPVFADIDPDTYTLDPAAARRAVRDADADAMLVVHLYGLPAAMAELRDVADEEDVLLVEDAAQAHGARFRGEHVGTLGDAAAFSFYPTKNMTTGEGGMVVTDREAVARRAASYVNHGRTEAGGYDHERVGHNYRMTSIAAAIGQVQLERLPEWVETRRANARRLSDALAPVPGVKTPAEPSSHRHAFNQYTVRYPAREPLREHLENEGVGTAVYYPTPIHRLEAYREFDVDAPEADRAASEVLSLPVHPGVDADDVSHIVDAIRNVAVHAR